MSKQENSPEQITDRLVIPPRNRSAKTLSTRIGPGLSGELLDTKIGGPEVADYFSNKEDGSRPVRIHDLPIDVDPQTTEKL